MITQKKVTVYNAVCSMCEAKGPDALSDSKAHQLAIDASWKSIEDYYICSKPEHSSKRKPVYKCNHENMGADGICNDCGALTRPHGWHFHRTAIFILDCQKESGEIDEAEYAKQKASLEEFKELAIELGTWRPARKPYPD